MVGAGVTMAGDGRPSGKKPQVMRVNCARRCFTVERAAVGWPLSRRLSTAPHVDR